MGHVQPAESALVELSRGVPVALLRFDPGVGEQAPQSAHAHVKRLADLPHLNQHTHAGGDHDHLAGLLVEEVEEDDELHARVEQHCAHADALEAVARLPELDVILEGQEVCRGETGNEPERNQWNEPKNEWKIVTMNVTVRSIGLPSTSISANCSFSASPTPMPSCD
jgi:hypothetical protein